MKILEITHRFPPAVGGSEKVVYNLSKEFIKQGHDVTVVTSTSIRNGDTRGFSTSGFFHIKNKNKISYSEKIDGINVLRFRPVFQFWPYSINPQMNKFLKKEAKKFDIIHVHGYQSYEADIVSRLKVPFILTAHDIIAHYGGLLGFFKEIYDFLIGKRILNRAKYLIALTPENKKEYLAIAKVKERIRLIPNGIEKLEKGKNLLKLRKDLGDPKKIVLFVGRLVEYKGAQHILIAAKDILKAENSTKFIFVGPDQGYKDSLIKLSKKMNIDKNCVFTGSVDNLADYYSIADVFILPSRGEGFGLSAVEAMSLGVPSVLADSGGLKYIIQEIGGYPIDMKKNIPSQISDYIDKIFKDGKIKQKMGKIKTKTEKFTWENVSKETLRLFKR